MKFTVYLNNLPKLIFLIIISFLIQNIIVAQDIPTGSWRDHLPYNRGISVAATGEDVYCATLNSLFQHNVLLNTITPISKINGLSDVVFSKLAYHAATGTLIIAYNNANVDLIRNGKVHNLADIKRQNLPINKTINDITLHGNDAWLSCGFGIVVVNLLKMEFKDTYIIGDEGSYININDIKFSKDTVFAATDSGIYRAAMNDYLPDFTNWVKWTDIPYPSHKYNTIAFFNDIPFLNMSVEGFNKDTLFYLEGGLWKHYNKYDYATCYQLDVFFDKLVMTKWDHVTVLDKNLETYRHIFNYTLGSEKYPTVIPKEAVLDEKGFLWIADQKQGLVFIYDQWNYRFVTPNGPEGTDVFHMDIVDDQLWVATGAYSSTWSMTFKRDGLYQFDGFTWKSINYSYFPILDTFFDYVCVTVDPSDPSKVYAGTWDKGIIFLKDGKPVKFFDNTNTSLSILENSTLGIYKVAIGGITFDNNGNMWVTNAGVTKSLSVMRPDGSWKSFNISSPTVKMSDKVSGKVVIDRLGQKWILLGRGDGIQVFNDNNTIDNIADDKATNISGVIGRGGLPSTLVTDIAIDLEGRLWIGSDKGIAVIYSPENVFSGYNYDAQQILVNQDGFNQYLLENETVTAIAVDGGNRKWIGTEKSGVFLLSADGTKELARFHTGNSPLLSDGIMDIVINHNNGEVFFATDKGIISYRGDATIAGESHTDVKVFPNPVKPNHTGVITIQGLVRDADVKITTVSGDVVYSTRANGGTAVWNGKDLTGKRVGTGVYLIFSSDTEGRETAVSKVLFIR